jgi:hypothetical protein
MAENYNFGLSIAEDAFQRAGIQDDTVTDKMKRFVNRAYFDILKQAPWTFALKHPPGIINTLAEVEDTITVTEGSASATITTNSASTDLSGRKVWQNTQQIPYRIITHSGTTLTLDATWKEDSASTADCTIFQDEYDLAADCLRPWSFRGRNSQIPFDPKGSIAMHQQLDQETYGSDIIDWSLIQQKKVRFKPWLKASVTVEYLYCEEQDPLNFSGSGAGDTPVVPSWDRAVIADRALLYQLYDWLDKEPAHGARIQSLTQQINDQISEMKAFYNVESDYFTA